MDKKNRKYIEFKKICELVSVPPEKMRKMISEPDVDVVIETHNKTTGDGHIVKTVSRREGTDEYLIEVYESSKGAQRIVYRNWIATKKPRNSKREPGISSLLGTIILMSVAAVGGVLFFTAANERASNVDSFVDVNKFEIDRFGDSVTIIASLEIETNVPYNVTIGGDIDEITLTNQYGEVNPAIGTHIGVDDDGVDIYGIDHNGNGQDGTMKIIEYGNGVVVSYDGILIIGSHTEDQNRAVMEITADETSIFHTAWIDRHG